MIEALGRIGFGLFGLAVLIGIVWLFSNNRRAVDWKLVSTGVILQIAFAALVLLVPAAARCSTGSATDSWPSSASSMKARTSSSAA